MATKIAELMTERPRAVTPETSVREAARLMGEEDVGSLPIVEEGARLVGILTDRDIALRVVGRGLDPEDTQVGEVASSDVVSLTPDDDLDEALRLMAGTQVRRLPVVVRDNELVGMLTQADVALVGKEKSTGEVVEAISRPPAGPRVAGEKVEDRSDIGIEERDRDDQSGVMADLWTYRGAANPAAWRGLSVEALDGDIGTVDEATDDVGGSYVIVDTGPWIFGKKAMLPAGLVREVDLDSGVVRVNRTKEQIKNAPELDESRYGDRDYRSSLGSYYGPGGTGYRDQ